MSDTLRSMPGTTYRNGMPPSGGYVYRGSGQDILTPGQIVRRVRQQITATRIKDGRCPDCGYQPTASGHKTACGGEA